MASTLSPGAHRCYSRRARRASTRSGNFSPLFRSARRRRLGRSRSGRQGGEWIRAERM